MVLQRRAVEILKVKPEMSKTGVYVYIQASGFSFYLPDQNVSSLMLVFRTSEQLPLPHFRRA